MQSLGDQTTVGDYQLGIVSPSLHGNLTPTIIEKFTGDLLRVDIGKRSHTVIQKQFTSHLTKSG